MISLCFVASVLLQQDQRIAIFNPLGNRFEIEAFGHLDDRADNNGIFMVVNDIAHKRLIDLELVD